jgi:hypothetical protein
MTSKLVWRRQALSNIAKHYVPRLGNVDQVGRSANTRATTSTPSAFQIPNNSTTVSSRVLMTQTIGARRSGCADAQRFSIFTELPSNRTSGLSIAHMCHAIDPDVQNWKLEIIRQYISKVRLSIKPAQNSSEGAWRMNEVFRLFN